MRVEARELTALRIAVLAAVLLFSGLPNAVYANFAPMPGWPVITNGGSRFSPLFLVGPDGERFLLHNQTAPGSVGIPPMAPWLVTRDLTGAIRPGWPVISQGLPLKPPAVVPDAEGRAVRLFTGGGRVNGLDINGQPLPGWPQPGTVATFRASPSLGDFDGDGVLEVLATDDRGELFVWRQDGSLYPGWPQSLPSPLSGTLHFILAPPAAADLDGDGSLEFVVVSYDTLTVYDQFGRIMNGWPWDVSKTTARLENEFAIVPLEDGTSGIAIGNLGSRANLTLLRHDGTVQPGWPQTLGSFRVNGIAAGDLDGDGRPELVAGEERNGIFALSLDGSILPGWPAQPNVPGFETQPVIVDFSGDGQPDVITLLNAATAWFLFGWHDDGSQIFATFGSNQKAEQGPTFGELDGDGWIDMAIATRNPGSIFSPGRVHVFRSDIPIDPASMHWPTYAHDYQRTSTWTPPTQLFGGRGVSIPPKVDPVSPPGMITMQLKVPDEALVEAGLEVTALGGFNITPIPVQVRAQPRLAGAMPEVAASTKGRAALAAPESASSRTPRPGSIQGEEVSTQQQIPMSPPVALRPDFNLIAQVNGRALMDAFDTVRSEHPELLLNDDELRQWLETDILPEIPTGEARPLWLTIESPRVGVKKLKAHVAVNSVVNP